MYCIRDVQELSKTSCMVKVMFEVLKGEKFKEKISKSLVLALRGDSDKAA